MGALKNILNNSYIIFLVLGIIWLIVLIYSSFQCNNDYYQDRNLLSLNRAISNQNENDILSVKVANIKTLEELYDLVEDRVEVNNDYLIAKEIQQIARESFSHGLSYLYPCENWLLFLISNIPIKKIKQKKLNAIIDPERIIKNHTAFCSQNTFIIQNLLNHFNIEYSSLLFEDPILGHFASAAKIKGIWYYLDGNIEYKLINNELVKLSDFLDPNNNQIIFEMFDYDSNLAEKIIKSKLNSNISQKYINEFPAARGLLFQKITYYLSNWFWLFLFFLSIISFKFRLKKTS